MRILYLSPWFPYPLDNGSTDGSVPAIRDGFPMVTVLENGENLGYTGGNNAGLRYALAQD
jgi:GT2 family glycosyltransferase